MRDILLIGILLTAFALPAADQYKSIESKTKVHRLKGQQRSAFDAFVYVNRIPAKADDWETPTDYAGRIYGRLANQEGRILLKLPPTMERKAYFGFKTFLGSEGDINVANCVSCHAPPIFTDLKAHVVTPGGGMKPTPTLRNLKRSKAELEKIIRAKLAASRLKRSGKGKGMADAYARIRITEADVPNLVSFVTSLNDVPDEKFRELIIQAKVFNTLE
ncbi:MAG: hypothetical protein ACPGVU_04315 [Limisphaerales bacterium]